MLEKYDVYLRPFNCQRTLHIYLPNDYYQSDERYPVVYMFDGHNLFWIVMLLMVNHGV